MDKNKILALIAVAGIAIAGILIYANSNPNSFSGFSFFAISDQQIAKKAVDYINNNKLTQTAASLSGNISEESGLVKFKIKIDSKEYDSYATKDGKLFFPQVLVMDKTTDNNAAASANNANNASASADNTQAQPKQTCGSLKKADKPVLEAYLVARCPFGLQMQRAMAEAIKAAPSMAQYMKVRYMVTVSNGKISSMHGDAEAQENLRQMCIREEQPSKYWNYVSCQMKAQNTENSCEQSTGVDSAKLSACVSDPSRGMAYAQQDANLTTKNNVSGSPTVILNGSQVSEFDFGGRDPDALQQLLCCSSSAKPGFCSTKLTTTQAATSFSATYASASSGSSNSGANCGGQ